MKIKLGSFEFTNFESVDKFVDEIIFRAINRESFLVCTPNLQFWSSAQKRQNLKTLINAFDVCIPDGWPIAFSLSIASKKRIPRLTGSDSFAPILQRAISESIAISIIGGSGKTQENSAFFSVHRQRIKIISPPENFSSANFHEITEELPVASPQIICICLGFPKQEELAIFLKNEFFCPIICLGASLDFFVGAQRRSPYILQKVGFEWLWRLLLNPRRMWKRYLLVSLSGLPKLIKEGFRSRK